jgi:hypothetical protein
MGDRIEIRSPICAPGRAQTPRPGSDENFEKEKIMLQARDVMTESLITCSPTVTVAKAGEEIDRSLREYN